MVTETWVFWILAEAFHFEMFTGNIRALVVLRVVRLMRIMRLVKLLRHMQECLVIIRGIGIAIRSISFVFMLLGVIIYVGAIVFRVLLEDTPMGRERFSSVSQAMGTLLVDCALSGTKGGPLMREAYDAHPLYSLLFFCFALLANVTMMGILGALLVQTIKKVTEAEQQEKQAIHNRTTMDSLWATVVELDENGDGYVTHDEFLKILSSPQNLKLLQDMDVELETLLFLADFMFDEHHGRLTQEELKQWVLDLRGSSKSTAKDHYLTRQFLTAKLTQALEVACLNPSFPHRMPGNSAYG